MHSLRSIQSFCLAAALVASAGIAHASTITYNLIGVTTSAGSLTGTIDVNSTNDLVTAANITFHDAAVGTPVYTLINYSSYYNGLNQTSILENTPYPAGTYGGQILLYFNTANVGTGNLSICTAGILCGTQGGSQLSTMQAYVSNNNGGPFNITAGSLDVNAPAAAPEPSSLLLFGTGLLGVAGLARRRFLKV